LQCEISQNADILLYPLELLGGLTLTLLSERHLLLAYSTSLEIFHIPVQEELFANRKLSAITCDPMWSNHKFAKPRFLAGPVLSASTNIDCPILNPSLSLWCNGTTGGISMASTATQRDDVVFSSQSVALTDILKTVIEPSAIGIGSEAVVVPRSAQQLHMLIPASRSSQRGLQRLARDLSAVTHGVAIDPQLRSEDDEVMHISLDEESGKLFLVIVSGPPRAWTYSMKVVNLVQICTTS
jgi:hypothetical protein